MKKHILLIDDNKEDLTIFMDALKRVPHDDGFKCTYAASPAQAIEMLKYLVPDYIFADFNKPEAESSKLPGFIKVQDRFKKTKLCLYSNNINMETKNKASAMGAFSIEKTSEVDLLASRLSYYLDYRAEPEFSI